MQITLYTNGRQVVSNDADAKTTADRVTEALGAGSKSVPMGQTMFMIYAEGENGVAVSAIVSELTFSAVPTDGSANEEKDEEAVPAAEAADTVAENTVQATEEKKTETVQKTVPAQTAAARPVAKTMPRPVFKPAARPVAKPAQQPAQKAAVQTQKAAQPQKAPTQTTQQAARPETAQPAKAAVKQRHYSI